MIRINGTTITLTRGDTLRLELSLTKDGEAYEMQDGDKIRFALKKEYRDVDVLIEKEIASDMILELVPEDTKPLAFGDYVYDIQMTYADGAVDTFIAKATFIVSEEVE
ncbi:MAG: hypothetical protein J6D36_01845 [Erysipelotrichaceae bacterium]|nr:hypothetical protein [Erysipelotrichaceae bacterium]